MKIVQLTAENVKKLTAISIKPDGSTVVIGGKNGAGKSTVLDSIMYALAGGDSLPPKPLRNGADRGKITLDLGDLTVTRKFIQRDTGEIATSLEVRRANGDKPASPQAILDELCGKMAFDPLEFSRLKPRAQLDSLKELVGLDFADLDQERARLFEKRTEANRQVKSKAAELAACPKVDAPEKEIVVADLVGELDRIQSVNQANDAKRRELASMKHEQARLRSIAAQAGERVESLRRQLAQAEDAYIKAGDEGRKHLDLMAEFEVSFGQLKDIDTTPVRQQIADAESVNRAVRQNIKHRSLVVALAGLEGSATSLKSKIEGIDKQKAEKMAAAPFPVPGLGFDANGITLNGLPFEQASSAERLRVSVAMGLALNPKLRVMLIRDGSLLDSDNFAMVAQMAEAADAQIWVERVGDGEEVTVVIEDGHVKECEVVG